MRKTPFRAVIKELRVKKGDEGTPRRIRKEGRKEGAMRNDLKRRRAE